MKTVIVTPPAIEPVTLEEAKAQLRIEDSFTLDDDYIRAIISAARDRCESYCNQFFSSQTVAILGVGTGYTLVLPYPNLTISSAYVDGLLIDDSLYSYNADTCTLTFESSISGADYKVEAQTSEPAQIVGVKHAIKIILTDLYELRTETVTGLSLAENPAVKALLYPYRLSLGL